MGDAAKLGILTRVSTLSFASIMASAEMSMKVDGETSITRPSQHRSHSQGIRASSLPAFPSQYTVGYVYSPEMMIHFSPHGHPEDPERITIIYEAIAAAGLISEMKQLPIRPVKKEESLLVHSEDHWDKVRDIQREYKNLVGIANFCRVPIRRSKEAYLDTFEPPFRYDRARNHGFRILL